MLYKQKWLGEPYVSPNDPVRTLERVAACLLNTWPNSEARWLCRKLALLLLVSMTQFLEEKNVGLIKRTSFGQIQCSYSFM